LAPPNWPAAEYRLEAAKLKRKATSGKPLIASDVRFPGIAEVRELGRFWKSL
jgi:hypothetical protein